MKTRILFTLFFVSLLFVGCLKEDSKPTQYFNQEVLVAKQDTFVLENQKLVTKDGIQITVKNSLRTGVFLAPVFMEGSSSSDNYLVPPPRKYETFATNLIDSFTYVMVSTETAEFQPANVEVANYDITIYYTDGTTEVLFGYLARYRGQTYTRASNLNSLVHSGSNSKKVEYEMTRMEPIVSKHKSRPQFFVTSFLWNISFDGLVTQVERLHPNLKNSNIYNPGHIL